MTTKSILAIHLVYPRNQIDVSIFLAIIIIDIFYPSGEPISLQSLRCSPFAVVHYRPDLTNQTSGATALPLQRPRFVNNPDDLKYGF